MRAALAPLLFLPALLALAACDPVVPDPEPEPEGEMPTGPVALAFVRVTVPAELGFVDYRDVDFGADGQVVALRGSGPMLSHDGGATWEMNCATPGGLGATAVSVRPDGGGVFAGSTLGRYSILGRDCREVVETGTVRTAGSELPFEANQVVWYEDAPGDYSVIIAMGNAAGTDGALVHGDTDGPLRGWSDLRPNRLQGGNEALPAAFTGIGVSTDDAYIAAYYEYVPSANLRQPRMKQAWERSGMEWVDKPVPAAPAVPAGLSPVGISLRGDYGGPALYLFRHQTGTIVTHWLRVETAPGLFREVTPEGLPPRTILYRAAYAPDGHVWLATSQGLYRSDRPVDGSTV